MEGLRASNFPLTWPTINYESLNIRRARIFSSLASLRSVIRVSYSASLFDATKANWRAYSKIVSSGEMKITLMLLADDVKYPSMYRVHDGTFDVSASVRASGMASRSSSGRVHLAMKSAKIYDLMMGQAWYWRSNSLSSTDHLIKHPNNSCFDNIYQSGKLVSTTKTE